MSKIITPETTLDQLTAHLDAAGVSYQVEHGGALQIEGAAGGNVLLVYWDEQDPQYAGWAWRLGQGQESGPLDGVEELLRLAVDKNTLVSWLEQGLENVYEPAGDLTQLSNAGVALCEAHGLRIDVDAYGCAYCPEHTIR